MHVYSCAQRLKLTEDGTDQLRMFAPELAINLDVGIVTFWSPADQFVCTRQASETRAIARTRWGIFAFINQDAGETTVVLQK